MRREAHPLWDFALAVYAAEGVEAACLALQDRHGLDVNLLLFCCWAGLREPAALPPARLAAALAAVAPWQREVVAPLRALRRRLRRSVGEFAPAGTAPLRRAVKALELDAEYLALRRLAAHVAAAPASAGAEVAASEVAAAEVAAEAPARMRANLDAYLRIAGVAAVADCAEELAPLMAAALARG